MLGCNPSNRAANRVGVAPDGLLTREYVVESAPALGELKIWVEMMDEDELLLRADDLVEALGFDREAFIPLPVPFFSELNFEDFITLLAQWIIRASPR